MNSTMDVYQSGWGAGAWIWWGLVMVAAIATPFYLGAGDFRGQRYALRSTSSIVSSIAANLLCFAVLGILPSVLMRHTPHWYLSLIIGLIVFAASVGMLRAADGSRTMKTAGVLGIVGSALGFGADVLDRGAASLAISVPQFFLLAIFLIIGSAYSLKRGR